jgi:hypothetical protein
MIEGEHHREKRNISADTETPQKSSSGILEKAEANLRAKGEAEEWS